MITNALLSLLDIAAAVCGADLNMPPKEPFKPKPSAKSEKNKPKGGKAKDEKRAADKAKKEAKAGGGAFSLGKK
ncbi:hypothetical protein ABBQ32_008036 [Trebouxia sp. C0010 RCD-2024]